MRRSRVDKEIVVIKNSLGFRGPEMPADFRDRLSVFTVGGSTTECSFLAEDKTWPRRLADRLGTRIPSLWLNNAGLDGHSTFGHIHLLRQILVPLLRERSCF
jgi:hypothetical protein